MKIGILSMQRLINFGSFLQGYGLKSLLEREGHEVEFIDVKLSSGKYLLADYTIKKENFIKKLARKLLKSKLYNLQVIRDRDFKTKYYSLLGIESSANKKTDYDAVVIGSDEVFSYCQFTKWGGTLQFFGEGIDAKKIISYAGSFGYTTLEDLKNINMDKKIGELLNKFDAISVRDQNSYNIVKELTGKEACLNLDPVLIYDFEHKVPSIKEKDYIFIYGYDNRLVEEEYVKPILEFAKKHNKKIISAGFYHSWCDKMINADPFTVLAYVKNADYVVCETFHGTIFSIKYQKQFVSIVRDSNNNKLADLLNRFNLSSRTFTGKENLEDLLLLSYDKKAVQDKIEEERIKTRNYLSLALKGDVEWKV